MKPYNVDMNDYHNIVKEFHQETDRAAAVLAGSYIENYLAKFIKNYIVNMRCSTFKL